MSDNFYVRKIKHFFHILDANQDGFLSESDLLAGPGRLAEKEGFSLNSAETKRAVDVFRGLYGPLIRSADSDSDGKISSDEFIEHWDQIRARAGKGDPTDQLMVDYFRGGINNLFDLIDKDDSGFIEIDEYASYLASFADRSRLDFHANFQSFDKNQDGKISRKEFNNLLEGFFLSEDEGAPGNFFFGVVT